MAQRFTDTQKWEDEWFTEMSNDYKIIWIYLLDTCDNAGIWKQNIKLLNFSCGTNISLERLAEIFKGRITKIDTDKWIINKFCVYQYGIDFLNSKNKAVLSAIKKLIIARVLEVDTSGIYTPKIVFDNSIDTLSIPYQYTTDSIKDKDKEKDKVQDIIKEQEEVKTKAERQDMLADVITGSLDKEQKEIANKFDNLFADEKQ
jgi:hypothetical protein